MNNNKICVFDLETDGSDPRFCSPVQIAAVIIDPIKLDIVKNSEFNISLKPEVMENDASYVYTTDILDFHAKVRGCAKDDIYKQWQSFPKQEQSWKMFISYLDQYHTRTSKKSQFSAPIAAGYNINRFDLRIVDRLSDKFGNVNKEGRSDIFYPRDVLDIMNLVYYWFENDDDIKSLSLDTLRDYFGISKDGAHDALKDVMDCAQLLIRFLKLHRGLKEKIKFRHAFNK